MSKQWDLGGGDASAADDEGADFGDWASGADESTQRMAADATASSQSGAAWEPDSLANSGTGGAGQFVFGQYFEPPDGVPVRSTPPKVPLTVLGAAFGTSIFGAVLGVGLSRFVPAVIIGWLLAGPAAVLIFGQFVREDTKRSARMGYGRPPWLSLALRVFPVLVVIAVGVCSYFIAEWAGRRFS